MYTNKTQNSHIRRHLLFEFESWFMTFMIFTTFYNLFLTEADKKLSPTEAQKRPFAQQAQAQPSNPLHHWNPLRPPNSLVHSLYPLLSSHQSKLTLV